MYGAEFKAMYEDYERRGMARETVPARVVWDKIVEAQIETGTPYMLYKDAANEKSNQKNLGTIRSSNLCTEIMEYTAKDEVAVCNLASIALPKFVNTSDGVFDHQLLYDVTYHATGNLNRVIDVNYYPVEEARKFKHAPSPDWPWRSRTCRCLRHAQDAVRKPSGSDPEQGDFRDHLLRRLHRIQRRRRCRRPLLHLRGFTCQSRAASV